MLQRNPRATAEEKKISAVALLAASECWIVASVQSCVSVPDGSLFFKFGLLESSVSTHSACNNKVSSQDAEK